jgi:hypothetical protein
VPKLIDFYSGTGEDDRGRKLAEILAWNDERLESTHDYIQWLFPLTQPSRFNPHAPLLTDLDRAAFAGSEQLRHNVLRALRRMLAFYAFTLRREGDAEHRLRLAPLSGKQRHWLSPCNHNYLRITRILTSLRLVGLAPWSEVFFAGLVRLYHEHPSVIGADTLGYWQRAARP